ncbi:MAG: bifunctional (p)ppGpp synthetase/guanosine-3',5'-bis(diphosphate) 3'-pyrophosphohydrolase [Bacteroidetes bacterium]|nr:bifunctional (p)ppGpp synthetase/guanosine-3',5'-bis(diphosphate) 3'-pyrophosphohydrolase [Bacteroidota bacterium]MCL4816188.1 bifunctional (p)ppGpp synthetase/guanosine-3',5'-bis(diphosphate) 3'-pyrophosphohydrolase [Flavobacteriales bacterium]NOG95074.1 bifunctional (p)ppGpp synthetase/guanosine-3',5'-bis(diphosphate) 3'-pyrophosphohydrolase [Bacteroidota bacterium]WKZ74461.1 MAG: bifunctional (p)ppGpp synthetase/guanosine-3',5'-bis(diphosphate) 3'-pyrophosphohydrolase [Vicingaceae bacteriu
MPHTAKNINIEVEKQEILRRYKCLLRAAQKSKTTKDKQLIRKAFDIALDAHKDMRRKTGEPYIYHPIAVAHIAAEEIGLGTTSIVCALLHDTVEDTDITLHDIERMFGKKVAKIIDGLTKISEVVDQSASIQAENFRKILLTLADDVRVILIKLADRLHNMRTLESMHRNKQLKIASETIYLYAPLAHRLGLYTIKSELEDLSLKYTDPEVYEEITQKLKKTQSVRTRFINSFMAPIQRALDQHHFKYEIKGRPKSIFSIYNKMKSKNVPFEEVYDVFAIRVVLDSPSELEKSDCWRAYSLVTDFYQPNPDRLRDWISTPKGNGYESLHTTVMSPTGKWVEVQIRSKRMDEIAEKGFAAHWKYKEGSEESRFDAWLNKIRDILENPESDALDFIDDFKLNLFADEIFIFTPKGDLKNLPKGSTALDFAFDIHTQVGYHCIGAKVNNKLIPLSEPLKSGDQVEIITTKKQKPKEDWLNYVITSKAKVAIKNALNEEKKKIALEGKEIIQRKFEHLKWPFTNANHTVIAKYYSLKDPLELFYRVAINKIEASHFGHLFTLEKNKLIPTSQIVSKTTSQTNTETYVDLKSRKDETLVIGETMDTFEYKLSPCCNPIPGDEVFGFITISDGIKIHKTNCPNAVQLMSNYAYRIVKARWTNQESIAFLAGIKVTGIDKVGIVNEITQIISSELNVNMRSISFDSIDGIFEGKIMVFVHDTNHLTQLCTKLKMVDGVIHVTRFDSN